MSDRDPDLEDIDPLERYDNREAATDYGDWLDSLTPEELAEEMDRLRRETTDPDRHRA